MEFSWKEIDLEVKALEDKLHIPNAILENVPSIVIRAKNDLQNIPKEGGCYWIWTNEPIGHSFHINDFPNKFDGGEIVYNGIAKDDIRGRIEKHLLGKVGEGMSAISIDLLLSNYASSHRKKALSKNGNTAYFNKERIREKSQLLRLNLSPEELDFVNRTNHDIHFRNGINVVDDKHKNFIFRVYFLSGFQSTSFGDIIEKRWRIKNGLPRLCTYSKGR